MDSHVFAPQRPVSALSDPNLNLLIVYEDPKNEDYIKIK